MKQASAVRPEAPVDERVCPPAGVSSPGTFHVVNLGCKVNRVEADALAALLIAGGAMPVEEQCADLIVVNTCTVTGEADKKARKATRHALSANSHARVIVTGCAAAIAPDVFEAIDERVEVVQRADLVMSFAEKDGGNSSATNIVDSVLRFGEGFRTRVNVKVQDGCDHACTYCIVHVARGKAVSKPFLEAIGEIRPYLASGVKEIVLTGIDLASYRDGNAGLSDLVSAVLEEADRACAGGALPARVRVGSVEPLSLDEGLIDLMAESGGRLCRHMHLPLQSGSTKVLREMARPYTAEEFKDLVDHLYERIPSLSITTDVICGFPGETEEDFAETLALARDCRFSKIHVFPYSRREGTPAATRSDQVPAQVKAARAAELRKLATQMRAEDRARRAGTTELVIVEDDIALTESYHEMAIPAGASIGELLPLHLA